ncbi:hypothetical protein [Cronobacter dublinensis]|uniref:hypothetical protein n=1 Tax=Cronobacter dublinensis TaxID=413497 RepID=UPI0024AF7905|nr:hypothetical protein [Cronobacter dublinensis]MDI7502716.1 hypothetical protein [Cronobacter dublinensis]
MNTISNEIAQVARAALDYIDALPSDVVARLPTMPGFDRDWAENALRKEREAAVPVGFIHPFTPFTFGKSSGAIFKEATRNYYKPVYAAPPAPPVAVPDDPPEYLLPQGGSNDASYRRGAVILGWKLCRAAMLAVAPEPPAPVALRERAEPVAYADPQAFRNFQTGTATKEWVWAKPDAGLVPVFVEAPPAPVRVNQIAEQDRIASDIAGAYMQGCRDTEARLTKALPAPPAPVVPDDMPKGLAGQIVSLLAHNIGDKLLAQKIWNACRAAMLPAPGKEG